MLALFFKQVLNFDQDLSTLLYHAFTALYFGRTVLIHQIHENMRSVSFAPGAFCSGNGKKDATVAVRVAAFFRIRLYLQSFKGIQ